MCQNALKTASSLMAAIEPTLKSLLEYTGQLNTPAGQAAIAAYDSALVAVQNWTSGTPAQEALELIGAFQAAFNTVISVIPVGNVGTLVNLILAGVETVIGVLTANSPAPAAPAHVATSADLAEPDEAQGARQAVIVHATTLKVQALVPTFKRSIWHTAASQYKSAWNSAVEKGNFPESLRAA